MSLLNVASLLPVHPAALAGVLVAVSFFMWLDGVLQCNKEANADLHFSFIMSTPAIFTTLGFIAINVTRPADLVHHKNSGRAQGFLFFGWVLSLGSSIGALVICATHFVGDGYRESTFPGIAIVAHSFLLPLAAVALWWSKGDVVQDDGEW